MTILAEVEAEIEVEDRKRHKNVLKTLMATRDRLHDQYYEAVGEVERIASMTATEFKLFYKKERVL